MINQEIDDSGLFNLNCPLPKEPLSFIEDGIFLGNFEGAQDVELLRSNGVEKVLALLEDFLEYRKFDGIEYKQVLIVDNVKANLLGILPECLEFVSNAQKVGQNVFVHCVAGISRSPSVLIAYFMVKYSVNYYTARDYVNKGRPGIYPNKGFISQLRQLDVNDYQTYLNLKS